MMNLLINKESSLKELGRGRRWGAELKNTDGK